MTIASGQKCIVLLLGGCDGTDMNKGEHCNYLADQTKFPLHDNGACGRVLERNGLRMENGLQFVAAFG